MDEKPVKNKILLFGHWYEFAKWLFDKTEKYPWKTRFTFSNRIDNLALNIMKGIVDARYSIRKKDILHRIDPGMERLRALLRLCHDKQYLDRKGYEFASKQINEAGKMVGGWRSQQDGRGQ